MTEFDADEFYTTEKGQLSYLTMPKKPKFLEKAVQPAKPSTSFFIFMKEKRQEVLQKTPGLKVTEIMKVVAELWSKIDNDEKMKFDKLAIKDRERYDK